MVKLNKDFSRENITEFGNFEFAHIVTDADKPKGMNLMGIITIQPGEEIIFHVHRGESDVYYIVSGVGEYIDNDKSATVLNPGDAAWADEGQGHGIKNISDVPLVLVAAIPFA